MIIVLLVVLGLGLGSFVNALVWRLHEQHGGKKLSQKQKRELSIARGRSMCPHCRHELAWYDLVPVVSWVILRGKCRYCSKTIRWQYPLVEVGTAALFVLSYLVWPRTILYGAQPQGLYGSEAILFGFWLLFLVGFMALVVYDLRWMELPNRIVYVLIGLAVVQVVFRVATEGNALGTFAEAFWGFLVIGGFFYMLFQVSDGKWIGGGDVKLAFMIGPLVGGPLASVMVIFLASLLGTFISLPFLASKSLKATSRIPFGPFLLLATTVVYLFGEKLVDFYWGFLL